MLLATWAWTWMDIYLCDDGDMFIFLFYFFVMMTSYSIFAAITDQGPFNELKLWENRRVSGIEMKVIFVTDYVSSEYKHIVVVPVPEQSDNETMEHLLAWILNIWTYGQYTRVGNGWRRFRRTCDGVCHWNADNVKSQQHLEHIEHFPLIHVGRISDSDWWLGWGGGAYTRENK